VLLELDKKSEDEEDGKKGSFSLYTELTELLVFGTASHEVENFLIHDLTEKGVKNMASSVDSSLANVQRLLVKYLTQACQAFAFHLDNLSGLVAAGDNWKTLGYDECAFKTSECKLLANAKEASSLLWLKGHELRQIVDESRRGLAVFFKWIRTEILRISSEPVPESLAKISQSEVAFLADFFCKMEELNEENVNLDKSKILSGHLELVKEYFE